MSDTFVEILAHGLTWAFVLGMAGCVVVIPMVAYQLFRVVFEKDRPEDE